MDKETVFKKPVQLDSVSKLVLQVCRDYPYDKLTVKDVSMFLIADGFKVAYVKIEAAFNSLVNNNLMPKRYMGSKMN